MPEMPSSEALNMLKGVIVISRHTVVKFFASPDIKCTFSFLHVGCYVLRISILGRKEASTRTEYGARCEIF
jgi:hypothetical protein